VETLLVAVADHVVLAEQIAEMLIATVDSGSLESALAPASKVGPAPASRVGPASAPLVGPASAPSVGPASAPSVGPADAAP
jgi:hypothetical protein